MVAWFLITTTVYLAGRLLFGGVHMIPYFAELQPAIVVVPIAGAFWGPAGIWGCFVAMLLGDLVMGMWGPLTPFRCIGVTLFALSCQRLWSCWPSADATTPEMLPIWRRTFRFLCATAPGCFIAATWPATAAETLKYYPFPYFSSLLLLNNLFFCALLGPALYRFMAREIVPYFGTWHDIMQPDDEATHMHGGRAALVVLAALGAYIAGVFAAGLFYGVWPTRATVFGLASGAAVPLFIVPFLILQVAGLCWSRKS